MFNTNTKPKRLVAPGYLLYEYLEDDDFYKLVGVVYSPIHSVNPDTGRGTDE